MNSRTTSFTAIAVIVGTTLVALIVQMALLGALHLTPNSAISSLALTPAVNTQLMGSNASAPIKFDASRGAAVAQARGLNLPARDVLAVTLATEDVTGNTRIQLGWLSTQNITRPAAATANLTAGADPQSSIVLLSGHPRWRETVTQVALGIESASGGGAPPGALVSAVELVPANPLGAIRLLSTAWFSADGIVVTPNESVNRLLPLALWLALICVVSLAVTALIFRRNPAERAAALNTAAVALALLTAAATVLANRWPGWSVPIGAGIAAVIALLLIDPPRPLSLTNAQRCSLALAAAGVCVVLSPLIAAVALAPAVLLYAARLPAAHKLPVASVGAALVAVPVLLIAAMSQGLIAAPPLLTPLADPTRALASVAAGAGGLPGLALGMLAMHQLWPAPVQTRRWSSGAAVATIWAIAGALFVLAVPKVAVTARGSSTYIALCFPALVCLWLALLPKFRLIAQSLAETRVVEAKTEADLSVPALALLESHAQRVHMTLARDELGAAHAALKQMQRIAPAARSTRYAELRVALTDGDLVTADKAATHLGATSGLSATDCDALLELAYRQNQQQRVIELAPYASATEPNRRALAMVRFVTDGPAAAIAILSDWPDESRFANELAELHLLNDDVASTQQALMNAGISMNEPRGQAYIARLGMRVQGPALHAQSINSLAVWHPQVGTTQAAQGELLQRQGNVAGARARFILAMKLDPVLWPLRHRLQALDATSTH